MEEREGPEMCNSVWYLFMLAIAFNVVAPARGALLASGEGSGCSGRDGAVELYTSVSTNIVSLRQGRAPVEIPGTARGQLRKRRWRRWHPRTSVAQPLIL